MSKASTYEDARAALQAGDYIRGYDIATAALELDPDDLGLRYLVILALARTGANAQAYARLSRLVAPEIPKREMPAQLAEDLAVIEARLLKNLALEAMDEKRVSLAAQSARHYEAALAIKDGHYPAINAATMWLLAGERQKAQSLAQHALDRSRASVDYWSFATSAEAHLLLGQVDEARVALAAAVNAPDRDLAKIAVTRRQLAFICQHLGVSWPSIDAPPSSLVVHYGSEDIGASAWSNTVLWREAIERTLGATPVAAAFGAIRNVGDLLMSEILLDRGIDVQLVLPTDPETLATMIDDDSGTFLRRLTTCVRRLRGSPMISIQGGSASSALLMHSSRCAMGLAVMRADELMVDARQFAMVGLDGEASDGIAGIVEIWRALGRMQTTIPVAAAPRAPARKPSSPDYETKALLFCDIKGSSKVPERQMPAFIDVVLGGLAREIAKFQQEAEYRETAGDGIYVAFRSVAAAAECGLALTACMRHLPPNDLPPLGIRVSAHVGPVMPAIDPVTGFRKFFGSEVVRAARIEPITPVGECYVTEQFASQLALEAPGRFNCDYAGVLESAKGYGAFRMYSLRRRSAPD